MKRATRTPNRFITSTQSWPVKGLALFLILLALVSCEENLGVIGNKRPTSRFGVYFKEFNIPVTTVQTDSLQTDIKAGERLLVGVADDPNFGKVSATLYSQFGPVSSLSPKIDKTGKSDFILESVILKYALSSNYYVYGDTLNSTENFYLYRITDSDFSGTNLYYANSVVDVEQNAYASASFNYVHDSIKDHRKRNADSKTTNDRYDTIAFSLPVGPGTLGQQLLDTAKANGVSYFDKTTSTWAFSPKKTDSVFRLAFPGFALVPSSGNKKIFGIKSKVDLFSNSTLITLNYSYVKDGNTVKAKYYYSTQIGPGYSKITVDRAGTALSEIDPVDESDKHVDFNVPDDYCYLQSGTGLFAKLDFSEVHNYFDASPDTIINMAINAAELRIDIEPKAVRTHLDMPNFLFFRVVSSSNDFLELPVSEIFEYALNYNCVVNGGFLDARRDAGGQSDVLAIELTPSTATAPAYYNGYMSDFMQYILTAPADFPKFYYAALLPADAAYGKSLHGLSFKKDKVKLRVYYTKTL